MTSKETKRRQTANVEIARSNPSDLYDEDYYTDGCSTDGQTAYGRREPWLSFFSKIALDFNSKYHPKTVVDIGCAYGLLAEAFLDLYVDAYGFDVSEYAISQARDDMKKRLVLHPITNEIPLLNGRKFDLAFCIEVLEHLPPEEADTAIDNLCATADRIVFSSAPDDFDEPTHFNVLPTEDWIAMFRARGFEPEADNLAQHVIAPHAFVVSRPGTPIGKKPSRVQKVMRKLRPLQPGNLAIRK